MEKGIIQRLIDVGIITEKDVEEYNKEKARLIASQIEQEPKKTVERYSIIENGVLIKFDERDLDESGNYVTPSRVRRIKRFAFWGCQKVNGVTLGVRVKVISPKAFMNCGLKYIDLGKVEEIGEGVFCDCIELEQVKISDKLKYVGKNIFVNCLELKTIITPSGEKVEVQSQSGDIAYYAQQQLELYLQSGKDVAK